MKQIFCADRENRTPVSSLARTYSTTKPYPQHVENYTLLAKVFKKTYSVSTEQFTNQCAPGGIRTPNDGSEDRCDIHFTTGALDKYHTLNNSVSQVTKSVYDY